MALTYIKTSGLDPTATFTMANVDISSNLTVANANVTNLATFASVNISGNMIPTNNNVVSLGDPTHVFKDVYIGPGSLYIDGSKVLEASGQDIVVTADTNQNLRVVTTGSGDIELDPTGSGVIAVKGPLQFEAGTQVTSSDGNAIVYADPISVDVLSSATANTDLTLTGNGTGIVKVDDDLTVTGNIIIQGTTGNLSVATLSVQDNIIDISAETTGTPSNNAGIRVIRGDDPSVQLRWNETDNVWQYTTDGTNYLTIVGKDSAGNVSVGNLSATGLSGTISTQAQPNITSVGSLASLTVTGLVTATAGGIKVGNIQDSTGTNTIQLLNSNISVTGNIVAGSGGTGNVTATYFIGNGSQLTGLPASYANANVAAYLPTYTGNYSGNNVTLTGNISTGSGTGNISGANYIIANYFQGDGSLLTGLPAGYSNANVVAYLPTFTGNFTAGNISTTGNITAAYYIGNGSQLTGLPASYANANVEAYLPIYTGNISANVITANNATINGSITTGSGTGNISGANFVNANYFTGNGSLLSSLTGGNVTGQVANSLVAGTVYTGAQPNITSTGTLSSLSVTANASAGNILTNNLLYANGVAWTFGQPPGGSNTQVQFNDAGTFNGSSGLTFDIGTTRLTANNFTATSTANLGSNANVTITGGTNGQVLTTNGSGVLSWSSVGGATVSDNTTTNANTFYPTLANNQTSGSMSSAVVSSTKLYFNPSTGTLNSTIFNSLSDKTVKTNLQRITNALEKLKLLGGYTYLLVDSNEASAGLLAQEAQLALPEATKFNPDTGLLSLNYNAILGLVVEGLNELETRVSRLENNA